MYVYIYMMWYIYIYSLTTLSLRVGNKNWVSMVILQFIKICTALKIFDFLMKNIYICVGREP